LFAWQVASFGEELLELIGRFENERRSGSLKLGKRRAPWRNG
jgi:hypothetical protein